MSNNAKFLKDVVAKKRKWEKYKTVNLTENCSAILQKGLPTKHKDLGSFTLSCVLGNNVEVLDMQIDKKVPLILGRPFLATGGAMIDVQKGELTLRLHDESITFNIYDALKFHGKEGAEGYQECNVIQVVTDCVGEVEVYHRNQDPLESCLVNSFTPSTYSSSCDANVCAMIAELEVLPERIPQFWNTFLSWRPPEEEEERKKVIGKPRGPPKVELKPLSEHLRYAFLGPDSTYPVVVSAALSDEEWIEVDQAKIAAIERLPPPSSEKAYEELKKALVSAPILITPDWSQLFEIMCDASDVAVGSAFGKKRDKIFRAIYYASRTLDSAQANYTTTEREMLAIRCADTILRRCVPQEDWEAIVERCHSSPTGGYFGVQRTAIKILQSGFYWPTIYRDSASFVLQCNECQRTGGISKKKKKKMPMNTIIEVELFDVWGIDFMGPFPKSGEYQYILLAVEYVSRWVEEIPSKTNNSKVVTAFVRKNNFCRFGTPRALISDEGSHFNNMWLDNVLDKYGVKHRFTSPYHPQANGQTELANREIKSVLQKTVSTNRKDWALRLDDGLWAYRTAYKTPIEKGEKKAKVQQPLFDPILPAISESNQ
ncbi:uncharacterized protein LOC125189754 [Salvia hispanica]|uniref:uncharacterized protein LOC125189754 n=1 Tax=Salvia hispanica TaxID=49212 RepID=UPI002009C516|nr:uncharacterized protein LOC125189754 [Salvia hispanica]